jgi:hypothetical protein
LHGHCPRCDGELTRIETFLIEHALQLLFTNVGAYKVYEGIYKIKSKGKIENPC